jgi:hypothetical protein
MVKIVRIFVVMTLLLVTFATPALAKGPDHHVPIKGIVLGEHGPPDFTAPDCPEWAHWRYSSAGEGHMSHLGKVEYSLTQCTMPGPLTTSEGTITLVAANGDELWLEHTMLGQMVGTMDEPEGFLFEGEWAAVGGTGRFTHASGSGDLHGTGNIYGIVDPDVPPWLMQTNFEGDITYKRK